MTLHPFNQRILAEDLVRVRRADDLERYAASQRHARIDPNPHQIDAVIFALRRLREGGCILADEVGLGKTIEAGLVIAQTRAEGAQRILLIVPKSLIGQWQSELLNLFGIQARESETSFFAPGVYLVGREFAGSERGAAALGAAPPFDLVVIDEAHEIFAGLHKRYGRDGIYDETSDAALMAHRVRGFLRSSPVLLLTATPMQNSLVELWGLVQYVEPTGTLLGDITTFRKVFCAEDDRTLVPGQEHELQRRLAVVLQRTLRRQAQEFLDRPFTQRRCRLYEYAMSDDERSLYDDVTEYLLQPSLYAFSGRQRRLLLIGFHRRMASSIPALAASLENVAARLRRLQGDLRLRRNGYQTCSGTSKTKKRRRLTNLPKNPQLQIDRATAGRGACSRRGLYRPCTIASERCQGALFPGSDSGGPRSGGRRSWQRQSRRVHRVDNYAGVLADICYWRSACVTTTSRCSAA